MSGWYKRGTDQHCAVLDEQKVRDIRRLYAAGGTTMRELGEEHGVSNVVIHNVVRRKSWKHVE